MQRTTLSLALAANAASAFYLPGVAPREYASGEKVDLKVNKLTSTKTQARFLAPPTKLCVLPGQSLSLGLLDHARLWALPCTCLMPLATSGRAACARLRGNQATALPPRQSVNSRLTSG